jgi:hypothetical protein
MADRTTGTREEWLAARLELLAAEKELTRRSDELARQRRLSRSRCHASASTNAGASRGSRGSPRREHRPAGAGEDDHRARTPDRVDVRPRPSQLLQVRAGQDGTRRLEKFSGGRLRCHGPILSPPPPLQEAGVPGQLQPKSPFLQPTSLRAHLPPPTENPA